MADAPTNDDGTVKLNAVKPNAKPKAPKDAGSPVKKVVVAPQVAVVQPAKDTDKQADGAPKTASQAIKKKDFYDRVMAVGDFKKNEAKQVVDATLQVLMDALMAGEEMNLPPLGKVKVQNSKDVGSGARALTVKVRTAKLI